MQGIVEKVGLAAAVAMPFFNIPLILKVIKRKSSKDITLVWVLGVWACIVLMAPSGFTSVDVVWRAFNYVNFVLFTTVMVIVVKYHKGT